MRVAFCGASGTGKTTLAAEWARLHQVEVNPVGSRSTAAAMGFASPYDVDRALESEYLEAAACNLGSSTCAAVAMEAWRGEGRSCRALFQARVQRDKVAWEATRPAFVTDRTTVCDLTYSLLHCPEAVDAEFVERARIHMATYDLVATFRISDFYSAAGDPARLDDLAYQARWESLAMDRLWDWVEPGRLVPMGPGSPAERLAELERAVRLGRGGRRAVTPG